MADFESAQSAFEVGPSRLGVLATLLNAAVLSE